MAAAPKEFNASPAQLKHASQLNARELDLFEMLKKQLRLSNLQLMLSGGVAGRFMRPVTGDRIGSSAAFIEAYRSTSSNPVAVVVAAQFTGVPGKQVKLSLAASDNAAEVVDYLGNSALAPSFGKIISYPILVKPNQALWITTANTLIPLVIGDVFTIRMFDAREYLTDDVWQTAR